MVRSKSPSLIAECDSTCPSELAVIIDDPCAHPEPSISALQKYNNELSEAANIQISLVEAKEAKEAGRAMSEEAVRKRKEREQKKALEKANIASSDSPESPFVPESSTSISSQAGAQPSNPTTPAAPAYTIVVPASSASLPWYDPQMSTYTTLARARTAGIWTYPSTLHERARCGVFRGLWQQGYFMGGGIKFGGDYLVYPGECILSYPGNVLTKFMDTTGDPLRYHSHFVASVIDSPISTLRPMEIVAHGRLGTATKKAHLLCGWDDEKQQVSYFSIEWAGFG